ncbi:HAMP domain-containing histidine kinase [Sphingomonas ginsenosidivorax]|uniref:histidine kinase n=1 Tax=Sphingomonas ginsenosidivorax TaxID=862135 RepID=A0A5C6UCB6_9SPHN|nr:HAMP domain-containing sensor histidine kinase [Sphingomonas ginsenosidivorax]TXC70080.1 HAMP domain-containing histidine kinase [Sphingomonas ginsenosidivorax]
MNVLDPSAESPVAHAVVDGDGVLRSADPALMTLNHRAGGELGRPLAVPAIATIARLARRLGIIVSRGVVVADDEADIDLWVRAQPEGDTVRLAVSGWREVQPWRPIGRASETRAAFLQGDSDWRWETDASLCLTFVSLEAGPRHGFDAFALLGQPLTAMFALDSASDGALPILDALVRRRAMTAQPARLRGSDRPVMLSAEVRHDRAGAFAGFIGAARMVVADAPPPPAEAPLSATFTGGLDRALRAPLARIVANADSINAQAEGPVQADYADYAADIASAGRHLLELVDDLVDLQAVERPDFTLAVERIDMADVARRAAGLLSVRAGNADVTISRPALGELAWALGDFRRVLQILVNLIGNAVRYSPPGSRVAVVVDSAGEQVSVTVADQGKGIATEDQARIFEKFERVDPTEAGGNGLGLYIARRLARAMQGDLTVESAPGQGARFVLTLPADTPRGEDQR